MSKLILLVLIEMSSLSKYLVRTTYYVTLKQRPSLLTQCDEFEIEDVLCLTFPMAMLKVSSSGLACSELQQHCYVLPWTKHTVKVTFVVLTLGESESLCCTRGTFSSHGFKLGHNFQAENSTNARRHHMEVCLRPKNTCWFFHHLLIILLRTIGG